MEEREPLLCSNKWSDKEVTHQERRRNTGEDYQMGGDNGRHTISSDEEKYGGHDEPDGSPSYCGASVSRSYPPMDGDSRVYPERIQRTGANDAAGRSQILLAEELPKELKLHKNWWEALRGWML
ncbi:hypothetical protein R1sor_002340 [Riccia sorocarpa]|uniref:Uncharacterized protein n=1 Tax=Riccia sorocarpa TaxID=122646 RepID=A0ABD3GYJ7_9MARC